MKHWMLLFRQRFIDWHTGRDWQWRQLAFAPLIPQVVTITLFSLSLLFVFLLFVFYPDWRQFKADDQAIILLEQRLGQLDREISKQQQFSKFWQQPQHNAFLPATTIPNAQTLLQIEQHAEQFGLQVESIQFSEQRNLAQQATDQSKWKSRSIDIIARTHFHQWVTWINALSKTHFLLRLQQFQLQDFASKTMNKQKLELKLRFIYFYQDGNEDAE